MIQTNLSLSTLFLDSWVLDIAYGSHLYKSLQSLQEIKNLNKSNFELFGASGESIQVEVVGIRILKLSSHKILKLKICYYISNIVRNIIFVPLLLEQDFKIIAKNNVVLYIILMNIIEVLFIDNSLMFLHLMIMYFILII